MVHEGSVAPSPTLGQPGDLYSRHTVLDGAAVLYVKRVINTSTGEQAWEPIVSNADSA